MINNPTRNPRGLRRNGGVEMQKVLLKIVRILACMVFSLPAGAATGSKIAVDGQGNIWWTGQGLPVPFTANAFQKTEAQSMCATQQLSPFDQPTTVYCSHAFVMKLDPNGNVLYATFLGGSSQDGGIAITDRKSTRLNSSHLVIS